MGMLGRPSKVNNFLTPGFSRQRNNTVLTSTQISAKVIVCRNVTPEAEEDHTKTQSGRAPSSMLGANNGSDMCVIYVWGMGCNL